MKKADILRKISSSYKKRILPNLVEIFDYIHVTISCFFAALKGERSLAFIDLDLTQWLKQKLEKDGFSIRTQYRSIIVSWDKTT